MLGKEFWILIFGKRCAVLICQRSSNNVPHFLDHGNEYFGNTGIADSLYFFNFLFK